MAPLFDLVVNDVTVEGLTSEQINQICKAFPSCTPHAYAGRGTFAPIVERVLTVERTGRHIDLASSEFKVTYPDGSTSSLWSPPWHEMSPEEEYIAAYQKAQEEWVAKKAPS